MSGKTPIPNYQLRLNKVYHGNFHTPTMPITSFQAASGSGHPVVHSALLDKDYLLVGNYVDEITKKKNGNGDYVDFAKLMPRDRISSEEDQHMEIVNKGDMSYWIPAGEKEVTASQTFSWENVYKYHREFRIHIT